MTIAELRKRSNAFVAAIDLHIAEVIEHNEKLLQLNKGQLKASKTSKGGSLINSRTNSARYSPAYAKRKGYSNPDLFVNGYFYKEMDLLFNEPKDYFITSYAPFTKYLIEMYSDDLFGINNKRKAKAITTPLMIARYRRYVL